MILVRSIDCMGEERSLTSQSDRGEVLILAEIKVQYLN